MLTPLLFWLQCVGAAGTRYTVNKAAKTKLAHLQSTANNAIKKYVADNFPDANCDEAVCCSSSSSTNSDTVKSKVCRTSFLVDWSRLQGVACVGQARVFHSNSRCVKSGICEEWHLVASADCVQFVADDCYLRPYLLKRNVGEKASLVSLLTPKMKTGLTVPEMWPTTKNAHTSAKQR